MAHMYVNGFDTTADLYGSTGYDLMWSRITKDEVNSLDCSLPRYARADGHNC